MYVCIFVHTYVHTYICMYVYIVKNIKTQITLPKPTSLNICFYTSSSIEENQKLKN